MLIKEGNTTYIVPKQRYFFMHLNKKVNNIKLIKTFIAIKYFYYPIKIVKTMLKNYVICKYGKPKYKESLLNENNGSIT